MSDETQDDPLTVVRGLLDEMNATATPDILAEFERLAKAVDQSQTAAGFNIALEERNDFAIENMPAIVKWCRDAEAENDRLRAALETIADRAECRCPTPEHQGCSPEIYAIAKAALERQ